MASGFTTGGTLDAPIERSDEWLAARKEIEAKQLAKIEAARAPEGKGLFETLEANKAAKQEAFEEANKLKHQFRALDQDEVEYLDSLLESERAEENRVRRETAEGLALFRQQQEAADKQARRADGPAIAEDRIDEASWAIGGKKRKRAKEKEALKGVKIRRPSTSTANENKPSTSTSTAPSPAKAPVKKDASDPKPPSSRSPDTKVSAAKAVAASESETTATAKKPPALGGLVDYGSGDDDW